MHTNATPRGRGTGRRPDAGLTAAVVVLLVATSAALSVDVFRTSYGLKGDEATYVTMALSLAYDGDLVYERTDVERFYRLFEAGPAGIHLKRGGAGTTDRLYYGKAFAYSAAAAPFVAVAGINGMWVFHAVLLAVMLWMGHRVLVVHVSDGVALAFTAAFLGVSILPLYAVYLTSDFFNAACVFFAYFLWFYKATAPRPDGGGGRLHGPWTDLAAAAVLGVATFSKPTNLLLIVPPLVLAWWQGRVRHGMVQGLVWGGVGLAGLIITAAAMGELDRDLGLREFLFIFQGGDRKIFQGPVFPFEHAAATFDDLGIGMSTNQVAIGEERLGPVAFLALLGRNLWYFLVGRHHGFLPFFFPGVAAVWLFVRPGTGRAPWQWAIVGTVVATAVALAVYMPYTWSGGGGPAGNRYYLSIYPAFFFLAPSLRGIGPAVAAWLGGGAFIAHVLLNPFVSAKQVWQIGEHGLLRRLPVELTMINDLPINLDAPRARVAFGDPPTLLYYLDRNAHRPEPPGVWVAAGRRAEIIVRSGPPLVDVTLTLTTPVANTVWIRMGGRTHEVTLEPGVPRAVTLVPDGVYARRSWSYLLSIETATGFVPQLLEPGSRDRRALGVAFTMTSTLGGRGEQTVHGW